jgi:iron complex outermembrane receptor protein
MKIQTGAMLLVFLGCLGPLIVAQEQSKSGLDNLTLEQLMKVQFYTASKHAQDASDAPVSITIITKADIRANGYRTLADALQDVRGFWVNSDRNYSYVGVRGFARPGDYNTRVLFLLNGHRLNDNIGNRVLIGTGFPIDMDLVERIEIVRGPGSSLYGANAVFGVVNVITQQPSITPTVEASVETASQFTGKARVTVDLPQILNGAMFSVSTYGSQGNRSLYFPEFNSPSTNYGVARNVDEDQASSAFVLLRWKHFQMQSDVVSRRKVIPTASFGTIFNDPGNHTTDTSAFSELSYKRAFVSGFEVTSRWFYDASAYKGIYAYDYGYVRPLAYDKARGDAVGTETNISRPLGHFNIVTAGTEFRYNLRQAQWAGLFILPKPIFEGHAQSDVFAAYAQDELRLGGRFLINAGVRVDRYSTYGSTASPRVAAIVHVDQKTAVKYSYGQAFRAPNAYELFYSNGFSQEPNPHLHPETIASQNLSVERVLTPTFHIIVEAFSNSMSHMLEKQIDPANGIYHFVNVDSCSGKGLEFELDAQRKGMRGELAYTVQRSIDGQTHLILADSPQHMAKLNAHVPLPHTLLVGFGLQYVSPQQTPSNVRIPDSLTTNVTLSTRKPILGFDLLASCYNLLDRRNYDPPEPSLAEARLPQDGRGLRIQITRRFSRN